MAVLLFNGCKKSSKELSEEEILRIDNLKHLTAQLNLYALCGNCELKYPETYYYPEMLKEFVNNTVLVDGKSLLFAEKYSPSIVGITAGSGFCDELDNGEWIESLIISIEEERIAEQITGLEEDFETDLTDSMNAAQEDIERMLSEEVAYNEYLDSNNDLQFMEYDEEIFIPKKVEDGFIIIHSDKTNVTRSKYDNLYRLVEKENWKIDAALNSILESTDTYEYYPETYKISIKINESENKKQIFYYNEDAQVYKTQDYKKQNDALYILSESFRSYAEGKIISDEKVEYTYKGDFKKLDYKFSKKYIYAYNEEDIPADYKYYENDILKMQSSYTTKNDYVSMIYFDGGFSVETIYESGKRIKDIYYQNNEVTRIKEYE